MLIQEMTRQASLDVVAGTHLGRLACARQMQPYIVPIHFAYLDEWLYSFSTSGQKIDWMRANPLVCVEVDQMRREQWATVVIFGRYEELCDAPKFQSERTLAFNLLQQRPMWWDLGGVNKVPGRAPAVVPVFYRIKIEQITGRRSATEQAGTDTNQANANPHKQGWLRKMFRGVRDI